MLTCELQLCLSYTRKPAESLCVYILIFGYRRGRLLCRIRFIERKVSFDWELNSSVSLQYLLSDKEIQVKTALWMAENSDYLKEQKGTLRWRPGFRAASVWNLNSVWLIKSWKRKPHSGTNQNEATGVQLVVSMLLSQSLGVHAVSSFCFQRRRRR